MAPSSYPGFSQYYATSYVQISFLPLKSSLLIGIFELILMEIVCASLSEEDEQGECERAEMCEEPVGALTC